MNGPSETKPTAPTKTRKTDEDLVPRAKVEALLEQAAEQCKDGDSLDLGQVRRLQEQVRAI